MEIHLFGAATPSGESFRQQHSSSHCSLPLIPYSRRFEGASHVDLLDPSSFRPGGTPQKPWLLISFAPIWLLAPFLNYLADSHPERLSFMRGIIACSSSSAITKRFATNDFDRQLVSRLTTAEDQLLSTCRHLGLPCKILRPTLIYGHVGPFADRNLSRLTALMRRLPILPLPAHTGLRQPIHASQLAAVVMEFVRQFTTTGGDPLLSELIALGGDSELSYSSMFLALQQSLPLTDSARRCRLLPLPSRLFYAVASPLLLFSPKAFEALMRMGANLSGFTPVHQLLQTKPQPFPVPPLF